MFSLLGVVLLQDQAVQSVFGDDVGIKVVREGSELVEELYAKDASGKMRLILVSPTHSDVRKSLDDKRVTAIGGAGTGLFLQAPSFRFSKAEVANRAGGAMLVLSHDSSRQTITKRIFVPKEGDKISVRLDVHFKEGKPRIQYLLSSYAFAPDGMRLSGGGKPDSTFSPAIRPSDNNVVGDHFFRAPAVVAQKQNLAAILMPDLDVLSENRPIPTIIDLDADNGVVDATLLSYGFCDHRLVGHVYFANDASMMRHVPADLTLGYDLVLNANAEPFGAYRKAAEELWAKYGARYYDEVKPQAMPFAEYARVCYPAALAETINNGATKLGWFEVEIDGKLCGGVMAGWGYQQGWASWQCWFNNLRSAWGMKWWSQQLPGPAKDWGIKADKMLNLALAAPMDRGACPTTYMSREKKWKGSLIMPRPDCYYDLTNMAWKGIWLLRWYSDFADCPRKDEILAQCKAMADCMIRNQNSDGSFPTWLTIDHKVVPHLDHSAQSALPAWFLVELSKVTDRNRLQAAAAKCADFLMKEVIDQQLYYDFETFFSCSPKPYVFETSGSNLPLPDEMLDKHTLQPPQNTLCMQWAAEALRGVFHITKNQKYMSGALKALDIMALYQNVWPISYRPVAYTYGGFGVQNSDGEFDDARQAQFGVTLCEFGAELGRKDLFERGVAAVRASLALINHPLHDQNGIYPNPNYPLGLMPENCGHGGTDQQNGRTGFDWGEGSGLTSMAFLLDRFGGVYVDEKAGWAVGVDGVAAADPKADRVWAPLAAFEYPWTGRQEVSVKTASGATRKVVAQAPIAIRRIDLNIQADDRVEIVGVPAWSQASSPKAEVRLVIGKERPPTLGPFAPNVFGAPWSRLAEIGPAGFAARVDPKELDGVWVWMEGIVDGQPLRSTPRQVWVNPAFTFDNPLLPGWRVEGTFAEVPTHSKRYDFNAGGHGFIGTCEDGQGGYDDGYMGTVTSPTFYVTRKAIKLLVGGGSGENVYVELIRADTGERIAIERGRNREMMDERTWDVSKLKGVPLRIRAVDRETGGWGHINVGWIRTE